MKPSRFRAAILLMFGGLGQPAYADRVDDLARRIEELEARQAELLSETSEERGLVRSFHRDGLTLGGFFESGFLGIAGPDTDPQASATSNIFGLNFSAEFSPKIRFVSQLLTGLSYPLQNPNNHPAATPSRRSFTALTFGSLLAQGYLEYRMGERVRVQGGLGYTPFGHSFQQRELVLFERRNGPQLLRVTNLVAPLWQGVHFYGIYPLQKTRWGWNAYSFVPPGRPRAPGVGWRGWWGDEAITTGLSGQIGKNTPHTYHSLGYDFTWRMHPFRLVAEYARNVSEDADPWSAYLEPNLYVTSDEDWLVFVFGDYASSPQSTVNGVADGYERFEYGTGINWLPSSYARLRFTLTRHDYVGSSAKIGGQARDYYSADASVGVAF